ncbi:hypothetical protein BH10ACT8_BH10ACT8_07410 [soil metagenome]|jgi:hypothetical protein
MTKLIDPGPQVERVRLRSAVLGSLRAARADLLIFASLIVFLSCAFVVGWTLLSPVGL